MQLPPLPFSPAPSPVRPAGQRRPTAAAGTLFGGCTLLCLAWAGAQANHPGSGTACAVVGRHRHIFAVNTRDLRSCAEGLSL